jgi:type VI secretion system secreted protein VgrG
LTADILNQKFQNNNQQKDNNMNNDKNFENALAKTMKAEGGHTDGKDQINDQPTNMGIKQDTLNTYNKNNPDRNFPQDVKNLAPDQAKEIYKNEYWDNTRIPNIENDRIRNAVFDMNTMGSVAAGKTLQNTLNSYMNANLNVDGVIGSRTINAINSIPYNKIDGFMDLLKENRLESLRKMENWQTSRNGWTTRTNKY